MSNYGQNQPNFGQNRRNEDQYGVVRAVKEIDEFGKKKLHPQKRFFADNLHHKSHAVIYGKTLEQASKNSAKGDHLYFDPSYASEYNQQYDQKAKKFMDQYLKQNIESQQIQPQNYMQEYAAEQQQMNPGIQFSSASKNIGPHGEGGKIMGQRDFFSGEEHSKFNSHWKRQEFLKGQWKIQDMDPESQIKKDIAFKQQQLLKEQSSIPANQQMPPESQQNDQQQVPESQTLLDQMQPNYYGQMGQNNYEKPAVGQVINQQEQQPQMEMPPEISKPPMDQPQAAEPQAHDEYQLQMLNDNQQLIKQCQDELEELKKAEAAFDQEKGAQQSSYGLNKDNVLIRSQQRPKGKLIYDSEQYHGQDAANQLNLPVQMPEQVPANPDKVIAQFGDTQNAEQVSAQIGNMYNAPQVADIPYQMTSPEQRRMILKPQGPLNMMNRPNQRYSLEQMRFLNKIKNASKRMNDLYKMQVANQSSAEKVKYAMYLEKREEQNLGANTEHYSPDNMQQRQPLGKVVTQVEMTNAEARNQLREMLEYQIREKERLRDQELSQREKIYNHSYIMKDQLQLQKELEVQKQAELQKLIQQQNDAQEIQKINELYKQHAALPPRSVQQQYIPKPPMPPPNYLRQQQLAQQSAESIAGLNSRRNKFSNHRYENRLTDVSPHFKFDGDIMNPHGRRLSHGTQLNGGAGVMSSAMSYGQGSQAMNGLIKQDAVNRAQVADQYYTQAGPNNKTVPAGVLGLQPMLNHSQSQQVLPRSYGRNNMLPPLNPNSAGPLAHSYNTPQNQDAGQRNFNFSALNPVSVGPNGGQAPQGMPQQNQARTLSRQGSRGQYFQNLAQQNLL